MADPTDLNAYPVPSKSFIVGERNIKDLDTALNGGKTSFTNRAGKTLPTYEKSMSDARTTYGGLTNRGLWVTLTNYNVNDLWQSNIDDTWYLVLTTYTADATEALDIASGNVEVWQGITSQEAYLNLDIHDTLAGATSRTDIQEGSSIRITDRADGIFDYVTGETANGFNIIAHETLPLQLRLRLSGSPIVDQFGAKRDGTNASLAIQAAINASESITFLNGTYLCNVSAAIGMSGSGKTEIKPFNLLLPALTLTNHGASWKYKAITNIDFLGFGAGEDDAVEDGVGFGVSFDNENTGRYNFFNCTWKLFDLAFDRTLGNIGIAFYSCDWEHNNIAIKAFNTETMHNGNMYMYSCQMSQNNKHCLYANADPSQIVFNDCIFQYNHGIWFMINAPSIPIYQVRDVYASSFNSCYMEGPSTDDLINVDGVNYKSSAVTLVNSRKISFVSSNMGQVRLYDSRLSTYDCYLSTEVVEFGDSVTHHHDVSFYNMTYPAIKSIKAVDIDTPFFNFMFQMESPLTYHDIGSVRGDLLALVSAAEMVANDPTHFTLLNFEGVPVARLNAPASTLVYAIPTATINTSKEFIVTTVHARTLQDTWEGRAFNSVSTLANSKGNTVAYSVISINTGTSIPADVTFTPSDGTDILDISQAMVAGFSTYEEAVRHVNAPSLIRENNLTVSMNLEGIVVDYSQIHLESYLTTITGIDFNSVGIFTTKFGSSSINKPAAIDTNFPICTATKDTDGTFKWVFNTTGRVIFQDSLNGIRYSTLLT